MHEQILQCLRRLIDHAENSPESNFQLFLPFPFDVACAAIRDHAAVNPRHKATRKKLWPLVTSHKENELLGAWIYTLRSFNMYAMGRPRYDAGAPLENLGSITLRKFRDDPTSPLTKISISEMPYIQSEEIPGAVIRCEDGDDLYLDEQPDIEEYEERVQRTKERADLRQKLLSYIFQALFMEYNQARPTINSPMRDCESDSNSTSGLAPKRPQKGDPLIEWAKWWYEMHILYYNNDRRGYKPTGKEIAELADCTPGSFEQCKVQDQKNQLVDYKKRLSAATNECKRRESARKNLRSAILRKSPNKNN
jgi:hypothetical protein